MADVGPVTETNARVGESSFAVAIRTDKPAINEARQIAHDNVIRTSGRARRSGVEWHMYPTTAACAGLAKIGIDLDLRPDVAALCDMFPAGQLVVATVLVDESVAP